MDFVLAFIIGWVGPLFGYDPAPAVEAPKPPEMVSATTVAKPQLVEATPILAVYPDATVSSIGPIENPDYRADAPQVVTTISDQPSIPDVPFFTTFTKLYGSKAVINIHPPTRLNVSYENSGLSILEMDMDCTNSGGTLSKVPRGRNTEPANMVFAFICENVDY